MPILIESFHELDLKLQRAETTARLRQAAPLRLRLPQDPWQPFVMGKREVIVHGLIDVDLGTGRPARQILRAQLCEKVLRNLFG